MRYLQIRSLVIILAIALAGTACDNGSNPMDSGENPATVEGRVEQSESQNNKAKSFSPNTTEAAVEGATVTAARITSDGSLETISGAEVETNAQGEFSLDINADAIANASDKIVVMAEKGSQHWKAFVTGELESGSTVQVQPLTVESSGEADVYSEIVSQGNAQIVSKADIEAYIDSKASSEIRSNADMAATYAMALAAEAKARARFFANQAAEISDSQMQDIMTVKAEAQAKLESDLNAASNTEEKQAAMEAFYKAVVQAYADADVDLSVYAKAKELSTQVLLNNSTDVSAEAMAELRANAAMLTSYATDAAVQARMEAQGVSQATMDAAAQAAVTLRSDIKATTGATKEDIDAAFETYNQAIVDALSQEFSASSDTIVSINTQINDSDGAKTTLESSIEASVSTDALVDAYSTFYSAVRSTVDSTFSSATDAEVEFVTNVMILANLGN